ncbi:MAG: hypothetical protein ACREAU_09610, partial [Nitrosopumilaceae archaeon]
ENTRFWNTNNAERVIDFNSLNAVFDRIVLLQANINSDLTGILIKTYNFDVLGLELLEQQLPDGGLPDIHRLSIVPEDVNEDGVPDDFALFDVFDYEKTGTVADFPSSISVEGAIVASGGGSLLKIPNSRNFINGFQHSTLNARGELDIEMFVNGVKANPLVPLITEPSWIIPLNIAGEELVNHVEVFGPGGTLPLTLGPFPIISTIPGISGVGQFHVAGNQTAIFLPGIKFSVVDSTTNNRSYTVAASVFGVDTTIAVLETIASAGVFLGIITDTVTFKLFDFVYFSRESVVDRYIPVATTNEIKILWATDDTAIEADRRFKRNPGRSGFNFAWFHFTPRFHLIDPAATNIIDIFIITKGYFITLRRFLDGNLDIEPKPPTSLELRTSYANLIDNKMISDTLIMHPGKIKLLFGSHAPRELRASFKVIRPSTLRTLTDNQVKVRIVEVIKNFLDINGWTYGETFYLSELTSSIHLNL